jgi:PAS domain S-box-containing protein
MVKSFVKSRSVPSGIVLDLTERQSFRVLHVDDDPVFLKAVKQRLEIDGRIQVDTALSVEDAMEKIRKQTYDAIVSDYAMSGKDGLDFLEELRTAGNDIPFIMFTGKGREEAAIKALNLGADGYFSKIGNPETVYRKLAHSICSSVISKRADQALRANESFLKALLDSVVSGLVVIDEETHKIVDANSHALETIGVSREAVVEKVCNGFICPAEEGKCPVSDLGQPVNRSDGLLLRADGHKIPIVKTVNTIVWRGRRYLIESFDDIAKDEKAEKTVLESEERFRTLMEEAPIGICNTDLKGKITYVNKRFEEATGYSREEVVGRNGFKLGIMSDETSGLLVKRLRERLAGNPGNRLEGRFKRKDGEWIWAEVEARLIKKFGIPVGFQLTTRDITERKRAEEERKRYDDKLSALNTHSRKLNGSKSMEEIYRLTMDAVEKTLGFEIAFFMVVDGDTLRVVDHRGYPEYFSMKLPLNGTKKGVSVKVARTGRPINVQDAEKEDAWVTFMPGIRSGLDVPVKIGRKVLGVIGVDSKELKAFSVKDQELLEILASHAATAMSNLKYAKNLELHARQIRESQEKFERLFMNNPEASVYTDSSFRIVDINPRFRDLFGYSLAEVKGKPIDDVIVPKDKTDEAKTLREEFTKRPVYFDTARLRKDGSLVPVSISVAPITVEGRPIGHVGLYRDIAERKRYEERLSALNTYSRDLNTAGSMEEIYRLTLDAMQKVLGFEYADFFMIDKSMLCIVDQRGYPKPFPLELPLDGSKNGISVKAAKTGNSVIVKDVRKSTDFVEGLPGILSELAVPIKVGQKTCGVLNVESKRLNAFDEKDQALLEILASHAATAMSNLEYAKNLEASAREIRESQQRFERLFMDNPEAAVYMDPGFHILDVNPRFCELFGFSLDEIKGKHIDDVVVPKDKMEEAKMLGEEFMKGPVYHDTVRKRKDGSLVPVSISGAPIVVENQFVGSVGLYKDISQLKKAEEELRRSQEKFERLFMDNPEAAVHLDLTFHILNINPRFMRLFDYSLEEVKGKHINDVIVPKEKMEEAVSFDERASRGEFYNEDTVRKRKDGSLVPVAFSVAPMIAENQVTGYIAVYKDISQLKKAEEELRQALGKLAKTNEKLRVVGGLTRHDARNKLSAITGNVYLAKKKLSASDEVLNNLKEMESATAQMVRIFDFAKTYEMLGVEELRFIDVEKMIDEAVSLFSDLKGVKVINNCHGLAVLADSLLRQLFYNLVDNSLKYGEKIKTITMYYEEIGNSKLKLVYQDDGVGIAESEKGKLFQEGYGRGTGYGLYLIRKMCEGYGWNIQETGKEGEGAQFTITIPRTGEKKETNYSIS